MTNSRVKCAILLTASSIVYLISAIDVCNEKHVKCTKENAWAIVFSAVGLFVIATVLAVRVFAGPDTGVHVEGGISIFLFLWWLIGACVGTFKGPFEYTGNGYFSAWASFIFASMYSYECSGAMREVVNKTVGGGGAETNTEPGGSAAADATSTV